MPRSSDPLRNEQEGDKLTFDLGPDVPGIVLDAEDWQGIPFAGRAFVSGGEL